CIINAPLLSSKPLYTPQPKPSTNQLPPLLITINITLNLTHIKRRSERWRSNGSGLCTGAGKPAPRTMKPLIYRI
ncbi:hypothetical protein, partial [Pseudomonas synxantha]|uniref:hypothetical protein n=1 Tax=Pseudomonas synxantha TaxID=47883 RepID=UPI001CA36668